MSCGEEPAMAEPEPDPLLPPNSRSPAPSCSICLDLVLERSGRAVAKLACGHDFHLDCIGSAFNAKGAMQCPNCRKIELGRWLYASGNRSPPDFDIDNWVTGDLYDLGYSELPLGFQWCPVQGFTQLSSMFEEAELQPISYHPLGDHVTVSASSSTCPYLALHGFLPPPNGSSSSSSSTTDATSFHHLPSNMEGLSTAADVNNIQYFPSIDPPSHEQEQQYLNTFSTGIADQHAPQLSFGLSRFDSNRQQRSRSVAHNHPPLQRSTSHGVSGLVSPLGPSAIGEGRPPPHGARDHVHPQFVPSMQSNPFPHARRIRPRALSITTLVAAAAAETNARNGFVASRVATRSIPESDNMARHLDQQYRWGREAYPPFPWIPVEGGESRWWSPFNPASQSPPPPRSFTRRSASERTAQNRQENAGFARIPSLRMPPYL